MIRFSRMLLCFLLILSALAGLSLLQPGWLAAVGLDIDGVPATMSNYAGQLERGERLDAARQDSLDRIEARQQVVGDVIDRRLRLAEAAARFQELDRADPSFNWERFRAWAPGASDQEKQCRAVIRRVRTALADDPDRAQGETRRLEEALQEVLRHGGPRQDGCPWAGGHPAPAPGLPQRLPDTENR